MCSLLQADLEPRFYNYFCTLVSDIQNPTLVVLVAGGGGGNDGLKDSDPPKPRCEASCRRLHGTEVVIAVSQTIPSGHQAAPSRMYASHTHWVLLAVTVYFPGSCRTNMDDKKSTGKWQMPSNEPCNTGFSPEG
jgi:hypothetical protein